VVVWAAPLVVMAAVVAREQAMEASRQAAVRQVAIVAPLQAVEEAAPLAVSASLWPSARVNRHVLFLMMMSYRSTRMSLYRSGCNNFLALG
jgi:hypothetical protein